MSSKGIKEPKKCPKCSSYKIISLDMEDKKFECKNCRFIWEEYILFIPVPEGRERIEK